MNLRQLYRLKSILYVLIACPLFLYGRDNVHFYNAPRFWGEPRFEREWLTTLEASVIGGYSSSSRNQNGDTQTTLLNLYGFENFHHIGENVPSIDSSSAYETMVNDLNAIPNRGNFGKIKYFGQFSLIEAQFSASQNLTKGFFGELHIPIRYMKITNVGFNDQTPNDGIYPHKQTPEWDTFLATVPSILKHYGLKAKSIKKAWFGDISTSIGWTRNNQDTVILDYIDTTIKLGIMFPTGKKKNENSAFDLPTGYNGHYGLPISFDASLGIFEWLTAGINSGCIFFNHQERNVRMKTSSQQNGFLKLAKGWALIKPGTIWHAGCYLKLDHFYDIFSWTISYCYNRRNQTIYLPNNTTIFPYTIVNNDQTLRSWAKHMINFAWEFDLTEQDKRIHPLINFNLNIPVAGHRIFKTITGGAGAELHVTWNF